MFSYRLMKLHQENESLFKRDSLYKNIGDYTSLDLGSSCSCCNICACNCE